MMKRLSFLLAAISCGVYSLYYLCREKLRDVQWHDGLLWGWLWWCLEMHDERMRMEAINPNFDGWVSKTMVPDFPKAMKASLLKRACEIQCYKRSGLVQDGTPSGRRVGSKCKICLLHEHLWYCVGLLTTQEMSQGTAKNSQMLPRGSAPRSPETAVWKERG